MAEKVMIKGYQPSAKVPKSTPNQTTPTVVPKIIPPKSDSGEIILKK